MTTLLIGTHAMLLAVTLDERFRIVDWKPLGTGHHYGMAPLASPVNQVVVKRNDTTFEVLCARTLEPKHTFRLDQGYEHIHQLASENGVLYITDTEHNRLGMLEMATGRITNHWFAAEDAEDIVHINSVFPMGGQLLVMLHNRGNPPSEIVLLRHDGDGTVHEASRVPTLHAGCHNVFFDGKSMYYNASAQGLFVRLDTASGTASALELGGHTKGLAASDEHFFVGSSEVAERAMRVHSRGTIRVVDRHSLECVADVPLDLPGLDRPVGNVNEIRLISGTDHCARATTPHPAPEPPRAPFPNPIHDTARP